MITGFDVVVNSEIIIWKDCLVAFRGTVLILIGNAA
jgi:hypothetical protein